jgi:drug/metabolite transporter (DMT)-like permease
VTGPSARPRKLTIVAAFAALYTVWGSTFLGILFAIRTIPPFLMAGTRFFVAGLIMLLIVRLQGRAKSSFAEWRTAFVIGACLLLCGNGSISIAEQWVPTGLTSLLVATVPIYIALIAWLSGSAPRPPPRVLLGLAGGFAGVGLLVSPALRPASAGSSHTGFGMMILLAGSFIWSVGSIYSQQARSSAQPFLSSAQTMLCGGALLLAAGLVRGETRQLHFGSVSALSLGALVYLILVGAIVGYTAFIFLMRHCDAAKVATYAYVNPVVAVILGALFADEKLTARTIAAGVIILGSVAIVIGAQEQKRKDSPSPGRAVAELP